MHSPGPLADDDELYAALDAIGNFSPVSSAHHDQEGEGNEHDDVSAMDLMGMDAVFEARSAAVESVPPADAADARLVHLMDLSDDAYGDQEPKRRVGPRPSTVGRLLFPASATRAGAKPPVRQSLPLKLLPSGTSRTSAPKRLSLQLAGGDAPVSPNTARRKEADSSLVTEALAKQLREEKARSRGVQEQHEAQVAAQAEAATRIRELEQALDKARLEQEGWQAEAQQLASRLEGAGPAASHGTEPTTPAAPRGSDVGATDKLAILERALALESSKRRRGKELQSKLRCELVNRRWKEKWEVELLEREERQLEMRIVELEAKLVLEEYEREMERLERTEAEVSALAASRQVLLSSFRTGEQTIASLRTELSDTRAELDSSLATSAERISELEGEVEALEDVKRELASAHKEVQRLERGEKKGDSDRNKELEKERAKREKLEAELKNLKAKLKTNETALKAAEKSLKEAEKAKARKADVELSRSSSTIKASQQRLSDAETDAAKNAHSAKPARNPTVPSEPEDGVASVAESSAEEEEEEEEAAPAMAKSRPRTVPSPKPAKPSKADKKRSAKADVPAADSAAEDEGEEQEEEESPPTPKKAVEPVMKRKADVLGDKSTNARMATGDEGAGVGLKVKKAKKAGGTLKASALALALGGDSEDEGAKKSKKSKRRNDEGEDEQPKKASKKRTLLGPRKQFDWGAESADINSMIPIDLSPIKKQPAKKGTGILGSYLSGPAGKATFF
ncbi:hypothetical protein JCM8202v2_002114 [Rhodotorula sphaerocarpa]